LHLIILYVLLTYSYHVRDSYKELGLTEEEMKKQARGIIINLQEHLEEFVQNNLN
jgi:hypothetical protein